MDYLTRRSVARSYGTISSAITAPARVTRTPLLSAAGPRLLNEKVPWSEVTQALEDLDLSELFAGLPAADAEGNLVADDVERLLETTGLTPEEIKTKLIAFFEQSPPAQNVTAYSI